MQTAEGCNNDDIFNKTQSVSAIICEKIESNGTKTRKKKYIELDNLTPKIATEETRGTDTVKLVEGHYKEDGTSKNILILNNSDNNLKPDDTNTDLGSTHSETAVRSIAKTYNEWINAKKDAEVDEFNFTSDDINMNELASYFEYSLHVPKEMSDSAKAMYS